MRENDRHEAIIVISETGLIERVIRADRAFLGYPELLGMSVFDFLLPAIEHRDDWEAMWRSAPVGEPRRVVMGAVRADQSVVSVEVYLWKFERPGRERSEQHTLCRLVETDRLAHHWNPNTSRFDPPEERLRCPNCGGYLSFVRDASRVCVCGFCKTWVTLPPKSRSRAGKGTTGTTPVRGN
ncbi:MAG: hypothetical protein H6813_05500 [Phycisphaeraceae bacterium]|nr:hypothetical protein [Phycisphaeraceae bacterium]MCB9847923.1 hypothetical protein [Phycisphaeraceae bacterium]